MVITHVAKLQNRVYSGVDNVVPLHVMTQQAFADVCLYNLHNIDIKQIDHYFMRKDYEFSDLPFPYRHPDLVVFHEDYNIENIKIARYLKKNHIPYIIVPHCELTIEAQNKKKIKKIIANLLIFNKFINEAIAIQCLSQRELDTTNHGKNKFIGTNGIEIPEKSKVDFNQNKIIMTYIGRLDPYQKGLDLMIEAAELAAKELCENHAEIHIYGPDSDSQKAIIEKSIKLKNMDEYIFVHEAVSGVEKEEILLNTDVFIQTSRFEGMPMGILEAISYGIPCLVTEGTTLAELVYKYDAGWICDNDKEKIASAMINCLKEKVLLGEKSRRARQLSIECFSWNKVSTDNVSNYLKFVLKD